MRRLLLPAACCVATFACGDAAETAGETPDGQVPIAQGPINTAVFDSVRGFVRTSSDSIPVRLEIADRGDLRAMGLMHRDSMAEDAGMIFLYDAAQPGSAGFWMYNTRIPLDIAFLDGSGRIVAIRQMQPCRSADASVCMDEARDYNPGADYFAALEMNLGWFERHGVAVGDRVVVPGRIGG